ncbi:sugar transporter ERD6-like 16 [Senna tora]|uniref:Sugar transporter ERD6-like 16 n=1 Tax=Senna tora TaxID=362788 RepID=A0A834TAK9_9FABA|nr:sugar transporter ERD6-like 16 [Senna tora]
MAINHDVDNEQSRMRAELWEPFIEKNKNKDEESHQERKSRRKESIAFVLLSTLVAVFGSYEFGSCVGYSTPVQTAIREDLELSVAEFSLFGSLVTIGAMTGAVTSGHIADLCGRKGAMRISAILSSAGWVAIYFSKGALLLSAGRFLTGYGIGVLSFVVPIYIAEIAPKDLRGGLATLNQLMIVLGASTTFILGTVVTWQTLALTGILPCMVMLLGLVFIPESPRWLAKAGKGEEFEDTLRKLRGDDADISHEVAEIQDYLKTLQLMPKVGTLDLFQRRYLHAVTIGVGLMFLQQFGGANGIGFYASETFVLAGFTSGKLGIIAFACIQIPITTLGAILMDNCGRKPLLLVSAIGTFVGCFLAGTSFFMKNHGMLQQWPPLLVLAGVLTYIGSFSVGMGAIPWVIMSEVFPTNIKGKAGGLVNLVHWFSAWAVSYSYNFLMEWSPAGTFLLYSGFCAMAVLFVIKVVPETKGKTLEEIQASLNSD